jgi:hypothetical protein
MNNTEANKRMILNDALFMIEKLAGLAATQGISEENIKFANEQINDLLNGPVKTAVMEVKITAAGIVTLS